jgi:hypothetical protein
VAVAECLIMMANAIWIKFKFMVWTFFPLPALCERARGGGERGNKAGTARREAYTNDPDLMLNAFAFLLITIFELPPAPSLLPPRFSR